MEILEYGKNVFTQITIMGIQIFMGYLLTKREKLTKTSVKSIMDIVFYIATPCVIADAILNVNFDSRYLNSLLMAALVAVLSHAVGLLAGLVFRSVKPQGEQAVYRFGTAAANAGFVALPLAQALFDSEAVLLVSIYVIVLNIFNWTFGRRMFPSEEETSIWTVIFNPGVIGVLLGILALLLKATYMPTPFTSVISSMGALNSPLAMLITGHYLVGSNIKACLSNRYSWMTLFLRQIGVPLVVILSARFLFGISGSLLSSIALPVSTPCATIVILFAAQFGGDTKIASQMVSFSILSSVLTTPLMLMFCRLL